MYVTSINVWIISFKPFDFSLSTFLFLMNLRQPSYHVYFNYLKSLGDIFTFIYENSNYFKVKLIVCCLLLSNVLTNIDSIGTN